MHEMFRYGVDILTIKLTVHLNHLAISSLLLITTLLQLASCRKTNSELN